VSPAAAMAGGAHQIAAEATAPIHGRSAKRPSPASRVPRALRARGGTPQVALPIAQRQGSSRQSTGEQQVGGRRCASDERRKPSQIFRSCSNRPQVFRRPRNITPAAAPARDTPPSRHRGEQAAVPTVVENVEPATQRPFRWARVGGPPNAGLGKRAIF